MSKFLFIGPTLSWHDIKYNYPDLRIENLESIADIKKVKKRDVCTLYTLPPVSGGDLYHFKDIPFSCSIGIVDGYFENTVSVLHKEILFLLYNGHQVLGSSSMGALRSAELHSFGMHGIGKIFHNYKNCIYEDDDEVTVAHGPRELGYPQVSEAMANIRFTLEKALSDNVLEKNTFSLFLNVAKSTFYKKRNYGSIVRECIEKHGLKDRDFFLFLKWLQGNRVDQKKIDALELVHHILYNSSESVRRIPLNFEDSLMWRNSIGA